MISNEKHLSEKILTLIFLYAANIIILEMLANNESWIKTFDLSPVLPKLRGLFLSINEKKHIQSITCYCFYFPDRLTGILRFKEGDGGGACTVTSSGIHKE